MKLPGHVFSFQPRFEDDVTLHRGSGTWCSWQVLQEVAWWCSRHIHIDNTVTIWTLTTTSVRAVWTEGSATKFGTYVGTDWIPMVLSSSDSYKIKRQHIMVLKHIPVSLVAEEEAIFPAGLECSNTHEFNDMSCLVFRQHLRGWDFENTMQISLTAMFANSRTIITALVCSETFPERCIWPCFHGDRVRVPVTCKQLKRNEHFPFSPENVIGELMDQIIFNWKNICSSQLNIGIFKNWCTNTIHNLLILAFIQLES